MLPPLSTANPLNVNPRSNSLTFEGQQVVMHYLVYKVVLPEFLTCWCYTDYPRSNTPTLERANRWYHDTLFADDVARVVLQGGVV